MAFRMKDSAGQLPSVALLHPKQLASFVSASRVSSAMAMSFKFSRSSGGISSRDRVKRASFANGSSRKGHFPEMLAFFGIPGRWPEGFS